MKLGVAGQGVMVKSEAKPTGQLHGEHGAQFLPLVMQANEIPSFYLEKQMLAYYPCLEKGYQIMIKGPQALGMFTQAIRNYNKVYASRSFDKVAGAKLRSLLTKDLMC